MTPSNHLEVMTEATAVAAADIERLVVVAAGATVQQSMDIRPHHCGTHSFVAVRIVPASASSMETGSRELLQCSP